MICAVESESGVDSGRLALAFFRALYEKNIDISDPAAAARIGAEGGFSEPHLLKAVANPQWKDTIRARTNEALANGIFGSPFIIVDGEGFWGADRLVDRWLFTGGCDGSRV